MILKRVVSTRTALLLLLGNVLTVVALSELNLDCTNEFDGVIYCQVDGINCTGHSLTAQSSLGENLKTECSLQECVDAQCCCSVKMSLTLGEKHTVTVWENRQRLKSKIFDVGESMKPKTPVILSVTERNGNFDVKFDTKMSSFAADYLTAQITYYKKGDNKMKNVKVPKAKVDGHLFYRIPGSELEPNTWYTVRVKINTSWSDKMSDSSKEVDFKTQSPFLAIIISLSVAAVVLSSVIYLCVVKAKTKLWDRPTDHLKPKLDIVHSNERLLNPLPDIISSISVDDSISDDCKLWPKMSESSGESLLESSGISPGSSEITYASTEPINIIAKVQDALCKDFQNIVSIPLPTTHLLPETNIDKGLALEGISNRTYSIVIPTSPQQNMSDSSEVQDLPETFFDSQYRSIDASEVENHQQQEPACQLFPLQDLLANSSCIPIDITYQQCPADSKRFTEENVYKNCDEAFSTAPGMNDKSRDNLFCDENLFYDCMPTELENINLEDDYQPFQSSV